MGGGNVDVWHHMISVRGEDRASYISSSVHNSRIERRRDVYTQVTSTYSFVFKCLEANEVLDPLNTVDLFCVHLVYIRINEALKSFQEGWNNHPLSTEHNKTNYSTIYSLFYR